MKSVATEANAYMPANWQPYLNYKSSGIAWFGDIPTHWHSKRLKYVAMINPDALAETTHPDYELCYIDISNVDGTGNILGTEDLTFASAPSRARRRVRHGDTIISTVRTYLKAIAFIENPPDNLIVSTGFAVVRLTPEVDPKYVYYLMRSEPFVQSVVAHSEGVGYPAIAPTTLAGLPVLLPPLKEQQTIVAFLDRQGSKITAAIGKISQLISVGADGKGFMAEFLSSLITAAVTGKIDIREQVA